MYISSRKALFSYAYITALAATVGYNVSVDPIDDDSVDCMLKSKQPGRGRLEVQLKATSAFPQPGTTQSLPFDLIIKNYNDLRLPRNAFHVDPKSSFTMGKSAHDYRSLRSDGPY